MSTDKKTPAAPKSRAAPAAPPAPAPVTPMDILNNAIANGASGADIDKYIGLIDRQRAADAEQAFIAAMVAFKAELPVIYRNATGEKLVEGTEVEWDFATLDRVCDHLIPALASRGIVHNWLTEQPAEGAGAGHVRVTAVITHLQGHSWRTTLQAPPDTSNDKTPTQAIQSTTTSLERYTLLAVCGVAVKQQRDDVATAQKEGPPEALLAAAIAEADKGHAAFGRHWKALSKQDRQALGDSLAMLEARADAADGGRK